MHPLRRTAGRCRKPSGRGVHAAEALGAVQYFRVESGSVVESTQPVAVIDRLYLVSASGLTPFRPVYEALSRMGFYSLNPDRIRDLQSPDTGELLETPRARR